MEKSSDRDEPITNFNELFRETDEYLEVPNPQLTHLHAMFMKMKKVGPEMIPMAMKKISENIVYSVLVQDAVDWNLGEEIEDKKGVDDSEGKFGYLEPLKQACLEWWEKNKSGFE